MTNSRNKGLRFELQVASLIEDELGIKLYRDLNRPGQPIMVILLAAILVGHSA